MWDRDIDLSNHFNLNLLSLKVDWSLWTTLNCSFLLFFYDLSFSVLCNIVRNIFPIFEMIPFLKLVEGKISRFKVLPILFNTVHCFAEMLYIIILPLNSLGG